MLPKTHTIIGLITSLILFLIFPNKLIEIGIFFFSSVLVDFDHYIFYMVKAHSLNLEQAYKYFKKKGKILNCIPKRERKEYTTGIYVFHGLEPIIVAILMGVYLHHFFFIVAAGIFYHHIFDWIEKIKSKAYPGKISLCYDIYKYYTCKKI